MAVVADAVGYGTRGHLVPENLGPAPYADVGRDDGRALLVSGAHQLEQQIGTGLVDVEVAQLVYDEQLGVGVVLQPLLEDAGERIGTFPRRFRGRDRVGWPWFEVETGPDGRAQSIAARQLLVA